MKDYKTRDLMTAAILIASGCKLKQVEYKKDIAYFVFENNEDLSKTLNDFNNDKLEVNASELFKAFKKLKVTIIG